MTNQEIIELEKKYMNVFYDVLSRNIGRILNQCFSQNMQLFGVAGTRNNIEHALENILEGVIADTLRWPVCSIPIASTADVRWSW